MKRSDVFLWLAVILIAALAYWLITTGRLQSIASLFVDGYWRFLENVMNVRARR